MDRRGYSLIEAVVAMTIFAIGIMALSQSYFGVMRAQVGARTNELAMGCARDRIEEIVNTISYADINSVTYPSEGLGEVDNGASQFSIFDRQVAIDDSLNANNDSVLKEITVTVNWQAGSGPKSVFLNSVIAHHSDITP